MPIAPVLLPFLWIVKRNIRLDHRIAYGAGVCAVLVVPIWSFCHVSRAPSDGIRLSWRRSAVRPLLRTAFRRRGARISSRIPHTAGSRQRSSANWGRILPPKRLGRFPQKRSAPVFKRVTGCGKRVFMKAKAKRDRCNIN
jgi:hypothetical protein